MSSKDLIDEIEGSGISEIEVVLRPSHYTVTTRANVIINVITTADSVFFMIYSLYLKNGFVV